MMIFSVPKRELPLLVGVGILTLGLFAFDAYFYLQLFGASPLDARVLLAFVGIGIVWYWVTGE